MRAVEIQIVTSFPNHAQFVTSRAIEHLKKKMGSKRHLSVNQGKSPTRSHV